MSEQSAHDGVEGGPKTRAPDGGQVALAGFLFQFLAAASDLALRVEPKRDVEDGGYELLLQFEHEAAGQDFSTVTANRCGLRMRTLTQCKYSGQPAEYKIEPSEFEKIVGKLLDAEQLAERVEQLETRFVLQTNRPPSAESRQILDVTEKKVTDESHLLFRGGNEKDPREARIVQGMRRLSWRPLDYIQARDALRRYASQFGVTAGRELEEGISRVVEYLLGLGASLGSHQVTRDDFVERLVGHRRPRPLAFDAIVQHLQDSVAQVRQNVLEIAPAARLVRRGTQETELAALADEALVLITGEGGCGKSALLSELLSRALSVTHDGRRLVGLLADGEVGSMAALVNRWRTWGVPDVTGDDEDQAVARVAVANPDTSSPVIIVGLDGVDQLCDDPQWHNAARALVRHFWRKQRERKGIEPPLARLIVTCRSVEDVTNLVSGSGGFGVPDEQRLPRVNIGLFTPAELVELFDREESLAPEVRRSLARAASHAGSGSSNADVPFATQTFGESISGPDPQAAAAVNILRHPVMWHQFLSLTPDERAGLLVASNAALGALAGRYVDWFCNRATKRHAWVRQDVVEVLGRVANNCRNSAAAYGDDAWVQAVNHLGVNSINPKDLAREAASSGLIRRSRKGAAYSPYQWFWRHAFVVAHLVHSS